MRKKEMELNGKKVAYFDEGSQENPPVLLLHGVPESSMLWKHVIPEVVESGFRAIAPDLPGFGQSDQLSGKSTWENYLIFLNQFMDELGLEQTHFVVHDWGGLIVLRWACDHPKKVASLVISDSSLVPGYTWHETAQKWRTPEVGEKLMESMANKDRWMAGMKEEIPGVDEDILEDFFAIYRTAQSRKTILDLYRSANRELLEPYQNLTKIKEPVTIIWGEKDPYVDYEFAYKTKEIQFPQAEVHVIPQAGHFIHVEVPDQVKPIIRNHFESI